MRLKHDLVVATLLLAPLGVGACPASAPLPRPRSQATKRPAPASPIREVTQLTVKHAFVSLLGVDWARREALLRIWPDGSKPNPPAHRLVTVSLSSSSSSSGARPHKVWQLPPEAARFLGGAIYYNYPAAQGRPWLLRAARLVRRFGPWYTTRTPALLTPHPLRDLLAIRSSPDKLALAPIQRGAARPLNHGSPACYQPAFSPNGRWLAYSCYARRYHEYCPTLTRVDPAPPPGAKASPGGKAPKPAWRRFCKPRGYLHSGPFWRHDSRVFYALARRGFGSYIDPVTRVCLVRVAVSNPRATALWCLPLHPKHDRHKTVLFRMDSHARTGVVLHQMKSGSVCRFTATWIRLWDGKVLATRHNVPTPHSLGRFTVLNQDGRLITKACGKGLLVVDLKRGGHRRLLTEGTIEAADWNGKQHLVVLQRLGRTRHRLLELTLP